MAASRDLFTMILKPDDRKRIESLAERWECSFAEVVRRCVQTIHEVESESK